MKSFNAVLILCAVVLSPAAYAKSLYEPDFTVLKDNITYDVEADGSFTYRKDTVLQINNQEGVDKISQLPIPFSESLQELEVLEAYIVTPDGERLDVGDDGIFIQQSPVSNRAPVFSDIKIQYIVFPGVEPGATLHLSFQRRQTKPFFPGEFSTVESFDITQAYKSAQLTVIAPESYPLHIEAIDIEGGEILSNIAGKKIWRWTISDTIPHIPEINSVSMIDVSPRVAISSFSSYQEIAKAYLSQADSKAGVTPEIKKQADKITHGINDRQLQAKALYNWVAQNIRYVAIFLEYGGVVPREAETVLKTRYGDCKDHVVLLKALLSAKNIESSQVLVNSVNSYWVPETAVGPPIFNHAINYLPEFDLYVDSTLKFASFGTLSPLVSGKTALKADTDQTQSQLSVIPSSQSEPNTEHVFTEIEVSGSGVATLKQTIHSAGIMELVARANLSQLPKGRGKQIVGTILNQMGQNGSGDVEMSDAHNLSEPFKYSYKMKFPAYISFETAGTFSPPIGVPSLSGISSLAGSMAMESRHFPTPCAGGRREEITVIKMPESVSITALPQPKLIENEYGRYVSNYLMDQNVITIERSLDLELPSTCDGETYTQLRNMAVDIALDLREQISHQ